MRPDSLSPVTQPAAFEGIPTFFRACCHDAKVGNVPGGYFHPGYHLTLNLRCQEPYDVELNQWEVEIDRLRSLATEHDDAGVLDWFVTHYPRCTAMVPKRRRANFLAGVYRAIDDGRLE